MTIDELEDQPPSGRRAAGCDGRGRRAGHIDLVPGHVALDRRHGQPPDRGQRLQRGQIPAVGMVDPALLAEPAESELAEAVEAAIDDSNASLHQKDYVSVLNRLARLRPQVDAFFDAVMVNAEDPALRYVVGPDADARPRSDRPHGRVDAPCGSPGPD